MLGVVFSCDSLGSVRSSLLEGVAKPMIALRRCDRPRAGGGGADRVEDAAVETALGVEPVDKGGVGGGGAK